MDEQKPIVEKAHRTDQKKHLRHLLNMQIPQARPLEIQIQQVSLEIDVSFCKLFR